MPAAVETRRGVFEARVWANPTTGLIIDARATCVSILTMTGDCLPWFPKHHPAQRAWLDAQLDLRLQQL